MEFKDRLKIVRGSLSKKDFSEKIDVHFNTISRWERGEQTPSQREIEKILRLYPRINPAWFVLGEGDQERMGPSVTSIDVATSDPSDPLNMVEGMHLLTQIYTSGDPVFIQAINANLKAFSRALEKQNQGLAIEDRMKSMEEEVKALKQNMDI